jgi:hypothetical protein
MKSLGITPQCRNEDMGIVPVGHGAFFFALERESLP